MKESKHRCEGCGAPAIVHIRPDAGSGARIHHFCLSCADRDGKASSRRDTGLDHAAILLIVGLVVLAISVGADWLQFGREAGFGWRQKTGIGLGAVLLFIGTLIQVPTIMVIGVLTGSITVLADWVAIGAAEGFGIKQLAGTCLGVVMVLAGLVAGRRKKCAVPPSPAEQKQSDN